MLKVQISIIIPDLQGKLVVLSFVFAMDACSWSGIHSVLALRLINWECLELHEDRTKVAILVVVESLFD
jgi:hypothetical protein